MRRRKKRIGKGKPWQRSFLLKSILIAGVFVFLFYNSWVGILFFLPCIPICYRREQSAYEKKEQELLRKEFKEVVSLITRGLELGHSFEHCIEEAEIEYCELVDGKETGMSEYLHSFTKKIQMNLSIQEILEEFAEQSRLEEVENFAEVVKTARKTGGNLPEILRNTSKAMEEKEQVQEEIVTMMSAKQMEQKIMTNMPILILAYMRMTSGDYMKPLYGNLIGMFVSTIGVVVIGIAIYWAEKIVNISV